MQNKNVKPSALKPPNALQKMTQRKAREEKEQQAPAEQTPGQNSARRKTSARRHGNRFSAAVLQVGGDLLTVWIESPEAEWHFKAHLRGFFGRICFHFLFHLDCRGKSEIVNLKKCSGGRNLRFTGSPVNLGDRIPGSIAAWCRTE